MLFYFRSVGVGSDLGCSKCDAHLGLLTDEGIFDSERLQYLTNGLAMTFSPRKKKVSAVEMTVEVPNVFKTKPPLPNIPPKLSIEQMLPSKQQ